MFRWGWSSGLGLMQGGREWHNIVGIIMLPTWIALFIMYYVDIKKENKKLLKDSNEEINNTELPPVGLKTLKRILKLK